MGSLLLSSPLEKGSGPLHTFLLSTVLQCVKGPDTFFNGLLAEEAASVDIEDSAVDESRRVGGQKNHCLGDLRGRAIATERCLLTIVGHLCRRAEGFVVGCLNDAGHDG